MLIEISKAQECDFDGVYEILMHEKVNPFMNYPVLSKTEFSEIWRGFMERAYLWKDGEKVIGLVVISKGTYRVKHIAYIEKLAINQDLCQKGWGTEFFGKIISDLAAEGFSKVELGVEADNERAISFYKKLGFEVEGVRKKLLNREGIFIDNFYMAKML